MVSRGKTVGFSIPSLTSKLEKCSSRFVCYHIPKFLILMGSVSVSMVADEVPMSIRVSTLIS
jgi:hypothetical protein